MGGGVPSIQVEVLFMEPYWSIAQAASGSAPSAAQHEMGHVSHQAPARRRQMSDAAQGEAQPPNRSAAKHFPGHLLPMHGMRHARRQRRPAWITVTLFPAS
jgi:hypothetical protein